MAKELPESPTAPAAVRLLLLLLLPLFALFLYLDGQSYDLGLLEFSSKKDKEPQLFPVTIAGLEPAGQVRVFDKDNLYEYINGHAEYFIGAGFRGLTVGEYGADSEGGGTGPKVVINLYDMGNALNAFGALMNEAGKQPAVDVGALGFAVTNGVSFIQGPYYAQVTLFDDALQGIPVAEEMAAALAEEVAAGELAFNFPAFGAPVATHFTREYYRGMDFLNNVLERRFEYQGAEFDAFTLSAEAEQIRELSAALSAFLEEDGIPFTRSERNGLTFYQVEDPYEGKWFFVPLPRMLLGAYTPLDERVAQAVIEFADASAAPDVETSPLSGSQAQPESKP